MAGLPCPLQIRRLKKLVIRQIGHQLLLQAGDSSSRILPVEERANREYLIRFAAPFTFVPDSLVATVRRVSSSQRPALQLPRGSDPLRAIGRSDLRISDI